MTEVKARLVRVSIETPATFSEFLCTQPRRRWQKLPPVRREELIRLLKEGHSLRHIAKVMGITVPAVSKHKKKLLARERAAGVPHT